MITRIKIPNFYKSAGIVIHVFRLLACEGAACGEAPILGVYLLRMIWYIFPMNPKKLQNSSSHANFI